MKEDLFFGYLGNGCTVADKKRTEHGDYMKIAHISESGDVKYYKSVSEEAKKRIQSVADEDKRKFLDRK